MRLVALCRMSVAYDDLGNDRQEEQIRKAAERRGDEVVAVKRDVMSATKFRLNDRPGYREGLELVRAGLADGLGVYHIDRLTRDNRDLEDVIDTKVPVMCASGEIDLTTDSGRTIARVLVAIAKGEVERKAARQKIANEQRFDMGLPWTSGPRPFGYSADRMALLVDEDTGVAEEAEAFRWAVQQALDGMSLRSIARGLATAGLVSSRAKYSTAPYGWTHGGIKKMLTNPFYAGRREYQGKENAGLWPKLIELETHLALKRKLTDPARDYNPGAPRNSRVTTNLLSKVALCDKCGHYVIAGVRRADPRYSCSSKKGCLYAPRAAAEQAVTDHILALISQPAFVQALTPHNDERVQAAKTQIDKLSRRLSVVNDDFNDGVYDENEEEYKRTTRDLRGRIKSHKQVIDDLSEAQLFTGLDVGTEAVLDQWDDVPLARRQKIIARFLEVRIKPTGPRVRWDAERHLVVRRRTHLAVA